MFFSNFEVRFCEQLHIEEVFYSKYQANNNDILFI